MHINSTSPLDAVVLQSIPALHAEHAWSGVSSKYSFLSTAKVIEALGSEGIRPYSCKTSFTRDTERRGYSKHMLRFRPSLTHGGSHAIQDQSIGGVHPEIVLTNSHDRGSSFCVELGLFRLICKNGLVVSSGVFNAFRVRHVGTSLEDVMRSVYSIIKQFPQVEDSVRRFQGIQLTDTQRENYAALAMGLRWEADKVPFQAARLLSTRRIADEGTDLWTTYNVVQENLLQGQSSRFRHARSTRAIKSIDADLAINRELWSMTESLANA